MHVLRKTLGSMLQPILAKRIYRSNFYSWKNIHLRIVPGVFHPAYFFSTKFLLKYILQIELHKKKFLELGAGSGLISITAAKQGAYVTASDISKKVIELLEENAERNDVQLQIIESDLFDAMQTHVFDIIAINPPYYPKQPRNDLERAWYCGEHFEYYEKLFSQLAEHLHANTRVIMVLSEDCDLEKIFSIAEKNHFTFIQKEEKKIFWERNYIFEIQKQ